MLEMVDTNENCPAVCDNLSVFSGSTNKEEGNLKSAVPSEVLVRRFVEKIQNADHPEGELDTIVHFDEGLSSETRGRYCPGVLTEGNPDSYTISTKAKNLGESTPNMTLNDKNNKVVDSTNSKLVSTSKGTDTSMHEFFSSCVMSERLANAGFPELKRISSGPDLEAREWLEKQRLRILERRKMRLELKTRLQSSQEDSTSVQKRGSNFNLDRIPVSQSSSNVSKNLLTVRKVVEKLNRLMSEVGEAGGSFSDVRTIQQLLVKPGKIEMPNKALEDLPNESRNSLEEMKSCLEPEDVLLPQKTHESEECHAQCLTKYRDIDNILRKIRSDVPSEQCFLKSRDKYACSGTTTETCFEKCPVKSEHHEDSDVPSEADFEKCPVKSEHHEDSDVPSEADFEKCPVKSEHHQDSHVPSEADFEKCPVKPEDHEDSDVPSEADFEKCPVKPEDHEDSDVPSEADFEKCPVKPEDHEDSDVPSEADFEKCPVKPEEHKDSDVPSEADFEKCPVKPEDHEDSDVPSEADFEKCLVKPEDHEDSDVPSEAGFEKYSTQSFTKSQDTEDEYPSDASTELRFEVSPAQYPKIHTEGCQCSSEMFYEQFLPQLPIKCSEGDADEKTSTVSPEVLERYLPQSADCADEYSSDGGLKTNFQMSVQCLVNLIEECQCCSDILLWKCRSPSPVQLVEGCGDAETSTASSETGLDMFPPRSCTKHACYEDKALDASQTSVEQYPPCRVQTSDYEHSSDLSAEINFDHSHQKCRTESSENYEDVSSPIYFKNCSPQLNKKYAEDKYFLYRSQESLEQCPPYTSEDCDYSTEESSETYPKEFFSQSPAIPAEDYKDEYSSDVLDKHYLQTLTPHTGYTDVDSYDGSAEESFESSFSQSPVRSEEGCELPAEISPQYSPLPSSESSEDHEYLSTVPGMSICSTSEMHQSEVSSYYISAVESLDKSLFKDMQGDHVNQISNKNEVLISESESDEFVTSVDVEGNSSRTWRVDDTEISSGDEGLNVSFSRSLEGKKTLERLPLDNDPNYVEICGETTEERTFEATATKFTSYYPGAKICEFSPFVCVLNVDRIRTHCSYCFKRIVNKSVCKNCSLVCYCSEKCQDEHYPIHQKECRFLLNSEAVCLPKYVRVIAHLIWKLRDPSSEQICDTVGNRSYYYRDLKSYALPLFLKECPQFMMFMKLQYKLLQEFLGHFYGFAEFMMLFAKFRRHMKIIADPEDGELGIGMYLGLAAFKHSCLPTANVVFLGNVAQVIARTTLEIEEPCMVTLRFVESMNSWEQRHDDLTVINGGFCNCIQCKDDLAENCEIPFSRENILTMFDAAKRVLTRHPAAYECDKQNQLLDACKIIGKMGSTTGQDNYIRGKFLEIAAGISSELRKFEEAIDYYSQLVIIKNNILGPYDPKTLDSELKLAKLQLKVGSSSEGKKNFRKVLKKVPKIYGYNHPYVRTIEKYGELVDMVLRF